MAVRTGFSDLFFTDALPVLENVVMEKYNSYPDMIGQVFNVESSDKWGEQSTSITGFGLAPTKAENAQVSYDEFYQGFDKTYTHTTYALAFRVSKEMIDDEKWGVVRKASQALGRSMFNTRQITAAAVFNGGASDTGPDGVSLINASHPLVGGGTSSNTLSAAADLSVTSLRAMIQVMEDVVDDRGLLLNINPRWLLIPNELRWDAEEILKSSLRPDNANNAVNAFQTVSIDYLVWNYLTDPDAWFMLSDKGEHSLMFYEREGVNTGSDVDWEADASKTKIRCRFSLGYDDFRGVTGTYGA